MKKHLKLVLSALLAGALSCAAAGAEETKYFFSNDSGTTTMRGGVSLGAQEYPIDVTVSVYDSNNVLNFQYVITTDTDGNAEFAYINDGESGDYTCYFGIKSLGTVESVTFTGFKGNDYYAELLAQINAYAKENQFDEAVKLMTEQSEQIGLDIEMYNELSDTSNISSLMKGEYSEYKTMQDAVKAFYRAVFTAYVNQEQSADAVQRVYEEDAEKNSLNLADVIPSGDEKAVLEELTEETQKAIFKTIAKEKYTPAELTEAFEEQTLLAGIKNAGNYSEVEKLLTAYNNDGKISISQSGSSSVLNKVYKNMRGEDYASYSKVEAAFKSLKSNASDSGSGGGGSSSGSSGSGYTIKSEAVTGTNSSEQTTENSITAPMYFNDIEDSKWALDAINYLYEGNVIAGNGDGTYTPSRLVTRAEFAKMLVSFRGYELSGGSAPFSDVAASEWYAPYVATAFEKNLFAGYEDGSFGVSSGITRQEAAAVIYRMISEEGDIKKVKEPSVRFADDDSIADWAKEAIYTLYANKVVSGRSETLYSPAEQLTRAEAAVLIYNARTFFQG